jgi:hypothetical protein
LYSKLLLLSTLWELEGIDLLWGNTAHVGTRLERGHLAQLLGLQEPHVDILLMCRSNLLLLLLEQLDLLLDSQLFHYQSVSWGSELDPLDWLHILISGVSSDGLLR